MALGGTAEHAWKHRGGGCSVVDSAANISRSEYREMVGSGLCSARIGGRSGRCDSSVDCIGAPGSSGGGE